MYPSVLQEIRERTKTHSRLLSERRRNLRRENQIARFNFRLMSSSSGKRKAAPPKRAQRAQKHPALLIPTQPSKAQQPPVAVAKNFVPIAFRLSENSKSDASSSSSATHYIYARLHEPAEGDGADDDDATLLPLGQTLFVANLPLKSSEGQIKSAFTVLGCPPDQVILGYSKRKRSEWDTLLDAEAVHASTTSSSTSSAAAVSPLFVHPRPSRVLAQLRPSSIAHLVFPSTDSAKRVLSSRPSPPPVWPSDDDDDDQTISHYSEIHSLLRPPLATLNAHVDSWLLDFDTRPPSSSTQQQLAGNTEPVRIQEDSDDDGGGEWTLVSRGGRHGKSALDDNDDGAAPVPAGIAAEFATGKQSVGIVKRAFAEDVRYGDGKQSLASKRKGRTEGLSGFYAFENKAKRLDSA
jgi:hypothetical protein